MILLIQWANTRQDMSFSRQPCNSIYLIFIARVIRFDSRSTWISDSQNLNAIWVFPMNQTNCILWESMLCLFSKEQRYENTFHNFNLVLIIIWKLPSRSQEKIPRENEHKILWELYYPNAGLAVIHFVEMKRDNPTKIGRAWICWTTIAFLLQHADCPCPKWLYKIISSVSSTVTSANDSVNPSNDFILISFWVRPTSLIACIALKFDVIPMIYLKRKTPITSAKCNQYLKSIPRNSPTDSFIPRRK